MPRFVESPRHPDLARCDQEKADGIRAVPLENNVYGSTTFPRLFDILIPSASRTRSFTTTARNGAVSTAS